MSAPNPVKNGFLIGAAALAALVIMAWIVSLRIGDVQMPMPAAANINAAFGTPSDLSKIALGAAGEGAAAPLPVLAASMPQFSGIADWLNSQPLTPDGLKGKVVLVDFWTYSCINCIRTLPYVISWYDKYKDKGLVIVGVHTPEFAFEKVETNVRAAMAQHAITYPVALDNDYGTWNAYSNQYWPAEYLFDAQGRLRHTHFGEGQYDETERDIQLLLDEAGASADVPVTDVRSTTDFGKIGSPETYIGYGRAEAFASPETLVQDGPQTYSAAAAPKRNAFYLVGTWTVEAERAMLDKAPGEIVYRFDASNANLVMGAPDGGVKAEVTLDGAPVPAAWRGADLEESGGATVVEVRGQRLYDLIDTKGEYGTHLLRIKFLAPGVEAYAFTFG